MQIKPLGKKIKIKMEEERIGAIQSDSVQEKGQIIATGIECEKIWPIGSTLVFKSWAVDVLFINGEKHYFISEDSDAICGIIIE